MSTNVRSLSSKSVTITRAVSNFRNQMFKVVEINLTNKIHLTSVDSPLTSVDFFRST